MTKFKKSQAGYSLISTASMIVIIGLGFAAASSLYVQNERLKETQLSKKTQSDIKLAMDVYRSKNGRYPCPAPMNAPVDTATFGKEIGTGNCSTAASVAGGTWNVTGRGGRNVEIGALPTRTLNIDDKLAFDGNGSRIVYAVTEAYASPSAPFNQNLGAITINDSNGNMATSTPGNAMYVAILPGSDPRGAYSASGTLRQPCDTSSMAGGNCDFESNLTDVTFVTSSFLSDAESDERFTALVGFESSKPEYYWNVGAWSTATCPTTCGSAASNATINRTVECQIVGSSATAPSPTLCPQNPVLEIASTASCAATAACPPPPPPVIPGDGGGGGGDGGRDTGFDVDGDGDSDFGSYDDARDHVASTGGDVSAGGDIQGGAQCNGSCDSPVDGGSGGGGGGGGGLGLGCCMVVTHFYRREKFKKYEWLINKKDALCGRLSKETIHGYHVWAPYAVLLMQKSKLAEKVFFELFSRRNRVLEFYQGRVKKVSILDHISRIILEAPSTLLGALNFKPEHKSYYNLVYETDLDKQLIASGYYTKQPKGMFGW